MPSPRSHPPASLRRAGARVPAVLLLLLVALSGCGRDSGPADGELSAVLPPEPGINVLVVSFDALRSDRLGVYGYPRPTSPHIDELVRDSVVFEHAWSAAQATPTSFAAMFTGRWPSHVFHGWRLEPGPTLASTFADAGYRTAFLATNVQLVASRHFGQGFDDFEILTAGPSSDADHDGIADDERLLERAQRWLTEEASPPFLLWVHFLSPHSPYTVREGSAHLYRAAPDGHFATTTGHTFEAGSEADLERLSDLYDGEVYFADGLLARLLDTLRESGHAGDTVLALTADHGEELMEHGGLQHSTVFGEVIRVPLILHHPRGGALRSELPASGVDLLPTLAAIAGLEAPAGIDGVSLLGPVPAERLRLSLAMTHKTDNWVAVGRGEEKLILDCRRGSAMLFDVAADPAERNDRLVERRRSYRALEAAAAAELGGEPCGELVAAIRGVAAGSGVDAETRERLRALGYLRGGDGEPPEAPGEGDQLWAEPEPILVCDGLMLGETVLLWNLPARAGSFELRVDAPDGRLMAQVGPSGALPTGRWVRDGMRFFVVAPGDGRTLASTVVRVTAEGCPGSS